MGPAPHQFLVESAAWIDRCAARLRRAWPTLAQADLDEVAAQLYADPRWRDMQPEQAAVEWLRLGAIVE